MSFMRAVATISGFTLLSRLAGFARDILMAAILGAGPMADAFFVALKLPNLFRRLFAEGAFSVSFIPLFSADLEKNGQKSAFEFAGLAQSILLTVLLPLSLLAFLFMPQIIEIIAPGFVETPEKFDLAVQYSQITFPYLTFISLTALYGGVLNAFNRFAPFAVAPVLFNFCLIGGLLYCYKSGIPAGKPLSYAVLLAGIVQFLFILGASYRLKLVIPVRRPKLTQDIKKLFVLMAPVALGAGVAQLNIFIDTILASLVSDGAVSYLYYADRLYQLPLGVIGVAIGTALLPTLSRALQTNDHETSLLYQHKAIEAGLLLTIPAAIALFLIGSPILHILFERGAFTAAETEQTTKALKAYAIGLPAFVLIKIFATSFFARQNTKTPVIIASIMTFINIGLSLLLIHPFAHMGIAMATAITAWINAALLGGLLMKKGSFSFARSLQLRLLKILVAATLMGVALFYGEPLCHEALYHPNLLYRIIGLGGLITGGISLYFGLCFLFGILRKQDLLFLLKKRSKSC